MAKDDFDWNPIIAGLFGVGVGVVLGRASSGTAVLPAGAPKAVSVAATTHVPGIAPGTYRAWLTHNGWSCSVWSGWSQAQQIQFLRAWFLYGDRTATQRGNDAYNQQFTGLVVGAYPWLGRQAAVGTSACPSLPTNPNFGQPGVNDPHFVSQAAHDAFVNRYPLSCYYPSYVPNTAPGDLSLYRALSVGRPWVLGIQNQSAPGSTESQLIQLLAAINADCQVTPNLSAATLAGLRT